MARVTAWSDLHLKGMPHTCTLVLADDPLLIRESIDAWRQEGKAQGYSERFSMTVDRSWQASSFMAHYQAQSLFSSRQLFELHCPKPPDAAWYSWLCQLLEHPLPDQALLIIHPIPNRKSMQADWINRCDQAGLVVTLPTPEGQKLRSWLEQRARKQALTLTDSGLDALLLRTEGHLLAADQSLEMLRLVHADHPIDAGMIHATLDQMAHYRIYDLLDAIVAGDRLRTLQILEQLILSGEALALILHILTTELRSLATVHAYMGAGIPLAQALNQAGIWKSRSAALTALTRRLSITRTTRLLGLCLDVDRTIKGLHKGRPEDGLLRLAMAMAGHPLFQSTHQPRTAS